MFWVPYRPWSGPGGTIAAEVPCRPYLNILNLVRQRLFIQVDSATSIRHTVEFLDEAERQIAPEFTQSNTPVSVWQNNDHSITSKRITIGRGNILPPGIRYQCYLSRHLNPVSEIMGEDQTPGHRSSDLRYAPKWFADWRSRIG